MDIFLYHWIAFGAGLIISLYCGVLRKKIAWVYIFGFSIIQLLYMHLASNFKTLTYTLVYEISPVIVNLILIFAVNFYVVRFTKDKKKHLRLIEALGLGLLTPGLFMGGLFIVIFLLLQFGYSY